MDCDECSQLQELAHENDDLREQRDDLEDKYYTLKNDYNTLEKDYDEIIAEVDEWESNFNYIKRKAIKILTLEQYTELFSD
jgi:uncharacterized coiled-coil DUF342 family protein